MTEIVVRLAAPSPEVNLFGKCSVPTRFIEAT